MRPKFGCDIQNSKPCGKALILPPQPSPSEGLHARQCYATVATSLGSSSNCAGEGSAKRSLHCKRKNNSCFKEDCNLRFYTNACKKSRRWLNTVSPHAAVFFKDRYGFWKIKQVRRLWRKLIFSPSCDGLGNVCSKNYRDKKATFRPFKGHYQAKWR